MTDDPSLMKVEDAADEQMSVGPEDVPISELGAQADHQLEQSFGNRPEVQPQDGDGLDSHPSDAPLLATKFSGNIVFLSIPELRNQLELRGLSTDPKE